ncbi:TIM barrel protein [Candidatus Halobonum tyrrellensis]|uniref:DUF7961 domain-containing protein n=1 Tax=Candidatus Halobonum tyrrellensis G22 TaxID=1324957 RepID=V4GTY9_9EURY|nr:TIM barrel protein [Candidatus Halobonum tyrrellensis]ESP88596.1 hypothetical protein K933_09052 [Candidatus Halobonum tyrrellensis G22]
MSTGTTASGDVRRAVAASEPADVEPVIVEAATLESTAPEYLRAFRADLDEAGYLPAGLRAEARFAADCSIETQAETDRLRDLVRAASFLGASRVEVVADEVAAPAKVEPALSALAERAEREGVTLTVTGPVDL